MRQYAGFATAAESNARYRYLLERGQTGLSVAFDLPDGSSAADSDAVPARGEVGKVGVAIDTIDDMETLFADIPLDLVTVSMTINAPASILLALLLATARRRGIPFDKLGGTIQNDIPGYYARPWDLYLSAPEPSMRLVTDVMAAARTRCCRYRIRSRSREQTAIREAGSTAVEETPSTSLAWCRAYLQAARDVVQPNPHEIAPRLLLFLERAQRLLEETGKRPARPAILWAGITRDEFGQRPASSQMLRSIRRLAARR